MKHLPIVLRLLLSVLLIAFLLFTALALCFDTNGVNDETLVDWRNTPLIALPVIRHANGYLIVLCLRSDPVSSLLFGVRHDARVSELPAATHSRIHERVTEH
ncbi:MAG: hypothetical protein C5B51_01630 [Terriglobia bacterium]|nr:MAG: hypothetical protein C5B51_01630 [Terriglobia bacterium]